MNRYATPLPINTAMWTECLTVLIADGWLNAEFIASQYGWIPNVGLLVSDSLVIDVLTPIRIHLLSAIRRAELTPADRYYSGHLQADLLRILSLPILQLERALVGLSASQMEVINDALAHDPERNVWLDKTILSQVFTTLKGMERLMIEMEFKHNPPTR